MRHDELDGGGTGSFHRLGAAAVNPREDLGETQGVETENFKPIFFTNGKRKMKIRILKERLKTYAIYFFVLVKNVKMFQ